MKYARIDTSEPRLAGAFGMPAEGQLPMATDARALRDVKPARSWWRFGARVVRNALVAVALMTMVPIAIVAVEGGTFARAVFQPSASMASRRKMVEPLRALMLPRDPSITPMQAGATLNAILYTPEKVPGYELIEPNSRAELPWHGAKLAPDMFVTARPNLYEGPESRSILEAATRGFSPREMEYLRTLATAPVWRDVDLVARAPVVDVIGGRFRIPFGPEARPEQLPLPTFRASRELAYASVSRAAYYMASGQPDEAERTLRSTISFGFAHIDNATSTLEELIGQIIVGIGRDALQRFYAIQHDPRATLPALRAPVRSAARATASPRPAPVPIEEARRRLVARVDDPTLPLGERFDGLQNLSASSCTNVRELMFGPRAEVTAAFARARHTVARFPSEQALVDLASRQPYIAGEPHWNGLLQALAISSASVGGTVLHNPRLAACTRILTYNW